MNLLQTRTVPLGDMEVRYAVTGHGDPLVLIHGLSGSWRWWMRNVPVLREQRTLYLIDLPGFGAMRAYGRHFRLEQAAEWLRSLLLALGLQRSAMIGHSMGGTIALLFAARWPHAVERLVLAAPAVDLPHKTLIGNIVPLLTTARRLPLSFVPVLARDALRSGPVTLARAAANVVRMSVGAELHAVSAPSLLVWGARDALVPLTVGEMLQEAIHGSRLHVIAGAGHVVMYDEPEEFNRVVREFLA